MHRNRASNLAEAARRAASLSMPCFLARLTTEKKQVADFLASLRGASRLVDFGQLLVDLGSCAMRIGPVETDAGGASLELLCACQGRQCQRNTGEGGAIGERRALGRLDRFPPGRVAAGEDMRMAPLELVADRGHDIAEAEETALLGDQRVENDLQLEVAKLVGERRHVVARDRVGDLVGFLDRVRGDRGPMFRWMWRKCHGERTSLQD